MIHKALPLIISLALLPAAGPGVDSAWNNLKSLAGEWEGTYGDKHSALTYTVVSGGHVVMESMKMPAPEPDMVTMYHRDGNGLMATHYCSMGNQPRMKAPDAYPDGKTIGFRFADITNLAKPGSGHIRHLTVTFVDANHLTQEWTSFGDGKEQSETFKWTRKSKTPSSSARP